MNPAVRGQSKIWDRILSTAEASMTPGEARALLRLGLQPADLARIADLGERAAAGSLTPSEAVERDDFAIVSHLIMRLQSSALDKLPTANSGGDCDPVISSG